MELVSSGRQRPMGWQACGWLSEQECINSGDSVLCQGVMMGDNNKGSLPLASPTSLIMDSGLRPMSSLDPCSAPSCLSHLAPSSCSSPQHQPVFLSVLSLRILHVCGQVWVCACVSVCMYANIYSECAYVSAWVCICMCTGVNFTCVRG